MEIKVETCGSERTSSLLSFKYSQVMWSGVFLLTENAVPSICPERLKGNAIDPV